MNEKKTGTALYAGATDLLLVALFALAGRNSHSESTSAGGVWETAWPFLAALVVGWLVCRTWRAPLQLWPGAVCLWLITVSGGMALRILSHNTAQLPFVLVAFLVLGLFLVGHRTVAALVMRRLNPRTR